MLDFAAPPEFSDDQEIRVIVDAISAVRASRRRLYLETLLAWYQPGMPHFDSDELMKMEAETWVAIASLRDLRILFWTIWEVLPDDVQRSFLAHANAGKPQDD